MAKPFYVTEDLYASNQQRLANFLIDLGVRFILTFIIGLVLGLFCGITGNTAIIDKLDHLSQLEEITYDILLALLYYNLTEIFLSRTIAKYITKTIVVLEDGTKPDAQTIMARTLSRIIPFDALSFLGTPCRGWHDSISKTYVVKKDLLEEAMNLHFSFDEIGKTTEEQI